MKEQYYVYLSLLLHPTDGHEAARQDVDLVNEWCALSVQDDDGSVARSQARRINFHLVASKKQPEYKMYRRDLPNLMKLAILASEIELTLELSKCSCAISSVCAVRTLIIFAQTLTQSMKCWTTDDL